METKWTYIKLIALIAVVAFLFGFANKRHAKRDFSGIGVYFDKGENRFVTISDVKKSLLKEEEDTVKNLDYITGNLRNLEMRLMQNRLIKNAEVYMGIDGNLKAEISQRAPIARIVAEPNYYVAKTGEIMPLSENFSARVPLVENATKKQVFQLYPVLKKIENDEFLSTLVTSLNFEEKNNLKLNLREMPVDISFGKIENTQRKFDNLKAFYKKMQKSESLKNYKRINLAFENQVVATKK